MHAEAILSLLDHNTVLRGIRVNGRLYIDMILVHSYFPEVSLYVKSESNIQYTVYLKVYLNAMTTQISAFGNRFCLRC